MVAPSNINQMFLRLLTRMWKMSGEVTSSSLSEEACIKGANYIGSYEKAVATLNTLQMPKKSRDQTKVTLGQRFAEIKDLPFEHLDKLAPIHVGGTKGKGSVCAFCESILRNSGYKTGFYSSPHLVEVRERIRVNGRSISKETFARYFSDCWENFEMEKRRYATFLVFMAFHVFLQEKVDVAIVEVGCGGEYDTTNVIRHPVVCGITLLDKDHLHYLGGTVESIAWHKAGIFKPGVPAFTVPQEAVSMKVLTERARERKTSLKIVPELPTTADGSFPALGIEGKHQKRNASLAVHLCQTWIQRRNDAHKVQLNETANCQHDIEWSPYAQKFSLSQSFKEGLAKAFWPGRSQCIEKEGFTFYLDGAHTRKSIEACTEWFYEKSKAERLNKSHKTMAKILIFNFKGDRNARSLLEPLAKCDFDYVVFCPNLLTDEPQSATSDISNFSQDVALDKKKCYENEAIWREVLSNYVNSSPHTPVLRSRVFPCVSDALHWIVDNHSVSTDDDTLFRDVISRVDHVQIFVTGSLYLVGMMLKLLETDNV